MSQATGLLLIGHGTRSELGTNQFLSLIPPLAARYPEMQVAPAFLELQPPTIADAIGRLVEQGTKRLLVAPLLLFAAGHAQQDIPAAVKDALRPFPEVRTAQMPALECEPSLLQLSHLRFSQACQNLSRSDSRLLVLVGRGSRELTATAKLHEFAGLLSGTASVPVRVGFLAMAEPKLRDVLEEVAKERWQQIIVQPHLLFQGELLEEMLTLVQEFAHRFPGQEWHDASYLGANLPANPAAEQFLLHAITSRIAQTLPALENPSLSREFAPTEALP